MGGRRWARESDFLLAAALLLLGLACQKPGGGLSPSLSRLPSEAEKLAVTRRLADMVADDQHARRNQLPWAEIDRRNTEEFKLLYRRYGWFTIPVWGAKADRNAFLIVQHSPDMSLQKQVLGELDRLRQVGQTRPQNFAFLFDRVALSMEHANGVTYLASDSGLRQRYGTQGRCEGGRWEPHSVEQPEQLDRLRASVGLDPIDEYRKVFACSH